MLHLLTALQKVMDCKMNFYVSLTRVALILVPLLIVGRTQKLTKDYSSFHRYPLCQASDDIRYPTTVSEIVSIVNEAIHRGVTVKAFGERHSTTDIICTEGIPVDMTKFQSFKMNFDTTATFGAGVTIYEASVFLQQNGRAFRVMPTFGNITLGGAVGTCAHGSSIKYPSSLSAQVARMTIVNGLGNIQNISDPEDLKSFATHLGLLAVVVDLTMYTVPMYKIKSHNYIVSDEVLTNGKAIDWARDSDDISLVWFPKFNVAIVHNHTFVPTKTPGNALGNVVPTSSLKESIFSTLYKELAFDLSTSECQEASTLGMKMLHILELSLIRLTVNQSPCNKSNELLNVAVGYPHEMISSICSKESQSEEICSWLHPEPYSKKTLNVEFSCELTDLPVVIATMKDILNNSPSAFPVYGILIRFSGKNDIYMSTSYGMDTVHIEWFLWKRTDQYKEPSGNLAGYQTIQQALAKQFRGRSHWGKSGLIYHSSSMLDLKLNPLARSKFMDAMKKFDPNGIFMNNFGRRLTHMDTKIDMDPLTTRCALLDNCFCSKNADCGDAQICTTINGYKYKACKTKNIVSTDKFDENEFSPNFNVKDWFIEKIPVLISSLKCP
ncbi:L-gulonolactone oxidase 2 [Pseudolycoriella hygida]|uniref:L-gulonolactone oxidase 2 n=1 Tax=Pseudolycoriella hygida TaxID=35572 RepID=A0A9Q0MNR5_9DIPT|nr:L-gulonolactone oxidase 2 [Pseudolycoriella hygida]